MSEMRWDPLKNIWVAVANKRGRSPRDFSLERQKLSTTACPFCYGQESKTPPEIFALRPDGSPRDQPGWRVRVVPNKYPMLGIEGDLAHRGEGLYDAMNGIGAHEVIIESPNHQDRFSHLPPHDMLLTFQAFRDRIRDLAKDNRFNYVVVFKNFGKAAGASLEHSHSQLVALPILPRMITSELDGSLSYYKYKDRCIFCDIIRQEIQQKVRLVCENDQFVTLAPFAPRSPFEMWVMPKQHNSSYIEQDNDSLIALAEIFSETLRRLDTCIPHAPYNFVLHTQPLRSGPLDHYHWHFEIVPKLTSIAGFEWGTGFYINPMPPEETCRYLREVKL